MKAFLLEALLSGPTLTLGVAAFIWIPLSLAIGRRPVFLLCTVIMLLATLWAGVSGSFRQLLAAACLQGFAGGLAMSTVRCLLPPNGPKTMLIPKILLMIIDITFIHERPNAIAIFWSLGSVIALILLSLVPEISSAGGSWRAFYIVWTIPSALAFLLAFFFYPETYFQRPAVAFDGHILVQSATEKVQIYEDWNSVPGGKSLPDLPQNPNFLFKLKELAHFGTVHGGWKAMGLCYPQILMCIINPLILWVALLNAVVFGAMMSIGMTYTRLLFSPPYSLPMNVIALVNLAAAAGALLAWPASGLLISKISKRLAVRNAGVRDAEHYLPAFILPVLTGSASVILYGVAGQYQLHYLFIYISYTLNTFATIGLGIANTLWVTEAFPRWAAPALVIVGGGSYVTSFAMSFTILPWMRKEGFMRENVEIGVLILVVGCLGIPVARWGKGVRLWIHGRWGMRSVSGALRPQ